MLPDPIRIARYRRAPELGPRILFFSGGSALRKIARQLKQYTHNSIHLVTAFDSGGSSAELRRAFHMLSVGDLRNRLLSLADETARGNPEIFELFSHRLPADGGQSESLATLDKMVTGAHPLLGRVPEPLRQIVRTHLRHFLDNMPADFDLGRASIGNLIMAGGYLANDRDINAVVFLFSKLVEVRGLVHPIVEVDAHIQAELESGRVVIGQHALTRTEADRIDSPVARISLIDSLDEAAPLSVRATDETRRLIREADLICYPMGSFYSSIVANLMPQGIGRAIAEARCPKIYVPNMALDEEQLGMTLASCVSRILDTVRADAGEDVPARDIIDTVLLDTQNGIYEIPVDIPQVRELGIQVVDMSLVGAGRWPLIDAEALTRVLLSLT